MKNNLLTIILYIHLLALIVAIIFIYHFEKKLGPDLIKCAENQVRQLATIVTNNSIKEYNNQKKINDLLTIEKNNNKEITRVEYNTNKINLITSDITNLLEKDLINMTKGHFNNLKLNNITDNYYEEINKGTVLVIPIASATGNHLLANIGPKIPLKLKLVGEVNTNIESKVKEYGLNNALIEIYAKTKSTIYIQMPFLSKEITITNKIPLTMEMIQGSIPEYYIGANKNMLT